jgi:hypothetical protein
MSSFCHIENISAERMMTGWIMVHGRQTPVTAIIRCNGELVAKARATLFRRDLLAAGCGHGHYGFAVPVMRSLPAGPQVFEITDAETAEEFHNSPLLLAVPAAGSLTPRPVDALLSSRATWADADIREYPASLRLQDNFKRLGARRFIDVVCRFLLNRWPTETEFTAVSTGLESGTSKPDAFFLNLLERTAQPQATRSLPSPYDPLFDGWFAPAGAPV